MAHDTTEIIGKKRKAGEDEAELEINLDAPEPPSKKALRKAKKGKRASSDEVNLTIDSKGTTGTSTAAKLPNGGRTLSGIWIGNLPYTTTKGDLQNFLTTDESHVIKPESISRIHLPTNKAKNGKPQNKGFAYVDFTGVGVLDKALQLSEKLFLGRRVLIKDAKNFEGRPAVSAVNNKETSGHPPNTRIFVGNLGFDLTIEDLENHFQACGPVSHIHMATFEDSGKCKGYAWVEFEQLSSAESAVRGWVEYDTPAAENKTSKAGKKRTWVGKIDGRQLRMEFAEDRTTRYNKRFGKGVRTAEDLAENSVATELPLGEANAPTSKPEAEKPTNSRKMKTEQSESGEPKQFSNNRSREGRQARKQEEKPSSGYARETVERLRGAMVPGEGKKIKFE
jgi:RNA recognition motif-containing protein